MSLNRRVFLTGSGALIAASAIGCGDGGAAKRGAQSAGPVPPKGKGDGAPVKPHYLVMMTLRGGFDSVMSVNPQDQTVVGDQIHCGYRADQRIQGSQRLYGPLIGGLERHDDDLCLIHAVRSDTTSHPDGLGMLIRGAVGARSYQLAAKLAENLAGDAPLPTLDLMTLDGEVPFDAMERPAWGDLRDRVQKQQLADLNVSQRDAEIVTKTVRGAAGLGSFLAYAQRDEEELAPKFNGFLGKHMRLAFQAIRGNWAKVINIGARLLYFDSHSDNFRYQRQRQPSTFADLATFIDLLKAEKNRFGSLYEQTTIAVFSEFGRYPRVNGQGGKDHWPENSWILAGKSITPGLTVGGTDASFRGLKVDFGTGKVKPKDGRPIFIDNAFATLVKLSGGNPTEFGYAADAPISCVIG